MTARIMLVDDTAFMRRMLRDILTKEGFEVAAEAANGREAVEAYRKAHPDLVIMDITMPEMDGIAAVREIIAGDAAARIVMCSALGQQELIIEALEAGGRDFVVKPFLPAKVLEAVRKVLEYERV
jgi:two-component system chemotaxis response regulator CheY